MPGPPRRAMELSRTLPETPAIYTASRVEWPVAHCMDCLGARIGVRANDPEFWDRFVPLLPPHARLGPWGAAHRVYSICSRAGEHVLRRNAAVLWRGASAEDAARLLASELHGSVARFSADLFVHAGVVGWRGRAIVIPGSSMAGKTTLVAELVRLGADYYSDEYAVISEDGSVRSYPKPLSIRGPEGHPKLVFAAAIPGPDGAECLRVGLIAAARHRPGACWKPRRLSKAASMLVLIANTVTARSRPEMTMARLRRAVEHAWGVEGERGEAAETARAVLETAETVFPASPDPHCADACGNPLL